MYVNYASVFKDMLVDLISLYFYAYIIINQKYNNKELFVTCALFNVSLMLVVMSLVRTDFNIAIGFGLFALLSLITVRSAPFTLTEIAYFFGAIALAVINGCGITDFTFSIVCNFLIVASAWCVSSWSIDHSANIFELDSSNSLEVVLDHIDADATNNPEAMKTKLEALFNLEIKKYSIAKIDYVKDTMNLTITYAKFVPGIATRDELEARAHRPLWKSQ